MSETWTIGELAERAAGLLGPEPRVNGRVREVPNERLIRWYTTIGLVDPPLARRGRVALYGRRHLLQLVAVKRRQADGLTIAQIQAELAGATDATLQRIAGLTDLPGPPPRPGGTQSEGAWPGARPERAPAEAAPEAARSGTHPDEEQSGTRSGPARAEAMPEGTRSGTRPDDDWCGTRPEGERSDTRPGLEDGRPVPDVARPAARDRFWTRPAPAADAAWADGHAARSGSPPVTSPLPSAEGRRADPPGDVVLGVRLAPGVTVLLDSAHRAPDGHEVAALRRAAEPLLSALAALGLAGPSGDAGGAPPADPHASDAGGMTQ